MSDVKQEELKPCPFCGGEAALICGEHAFVDFKVRCTHDNCWAESGLFNGPDSNTNRSETIAAWNRRSDAAIAQARREALPLLEALRNVIHLIPHGEYPENRCQVCGWPLAKDMHTGCVPGSCSMRTDEPQAQRTYQNQRFWLATKAAIVNYESALAAEKEG